MLVWEWMQGNPKMHYARLVLQEVVTFINIVTGFTSENFQTAKVLSILGRIVYQ